MKIIVDSSPLISFAIFDQLELLPSLFSELYVPEAVFNEVSRLKAGQAALLDLALFC